MLIYYCVQIAIQTRVDDSNLTALIDSSPAPVMINLHQTCAGKIIDDRKAERPQRCDVMNLYTCRSPLSACYHRLMSPSGRGFASFEITVAGLSPDFCQRGHPELQLQPDPQP